MCAFRHVKAIPIMIIFLSIKSCDSGDVEDFLTQYGYLPSSSNSISLSDAMKIFQRFSGLTITGKMDRDTLEQIESPRCGLKDSPVQNFELQSSKWPKKRVTYRVLNAPRALSEGRTKREIGKAFDLWSGVSDLNFADIQISFEKKGHKCDGGAFDEKGNTLAHAFFPEFGGDIHFNGDKSWSTDYDGNNLLQVAAHEIGHSLGLEHSKVKQALMAPTYKNKEPEPLLHRDDREGIQALYGVNPGNGNRGNLCKPLWDNSCRNHDECCSKNCYKESHWAVGVCKVGSSGRPVPPTAGGCRPLWDNTCTSNTDCCSKYCFRESWWKYGVCKPGSSGGPDGGGGGGSGDGTCKPLWNNSCSTNEECCSKYCFKESHWAVGVCKPGANVPTHLSGGGSGGSCKPLWNNSCTGNDDCCSKNCFKEPHWAVGVCKP